MEVIKTAIKKGKRVIDLGGDFRISDTAVYTKYYKHEHTATELLNKSVYGLSEWNQKEISNAQLLANPGCYPTSVLLALLPILKAGVIKEDFISVTSYSGTSGAGKSVNAGMMFSEVNESVRAYKAGNHQHIPEIGQYLKSFSGKEASFTFIPHLLPITRGIYTTIHTKIKNEISGKEVSEIFIKKYSQEKFVRFLGEELPEIKNVQDTNFCDIGFSLFDENLILFSTIDNLVKGAAGQAVQNMNIMYNIPQETGLLLWNKNQW
jgi:N-acetyl-gamma-glutamyl-phosphate reductase